MLKKRSYEAVGVNCNQFLIMIGNKANVRNEFFAGNQSRSGNCF